MNEIAVQTVEEVRNIGKHCWLGVEAKIYDFDPPREPISNAPLASNVGRKPMNRFVFQADGGTSLDGEITKDGRGFKIIHNGHLENNYIEDIAFNGHVWQPGSVVPFSLFLLAVKYHVQLANYRAGGDCGFTMHRGKIVPLRIAENEGFQ